jgi:nucleoside 2-deoxyribosyltransferase
MKPNPTVYIAAAMSNGRETLFNLGLADRLARDIGCETILPQRDGLEFTGLAQALSERLPPEEVMPAAQNIIYSLDIGYLLPRSDLIIANLDEPQDEGVIAEMCYGGKLGKRIIGFRTDTRPPFGALADAFRGMRTFPAYQCDILVSHSIQARSRLSAERELEALIHKLREAIIGLRPQIADGIPDQALSDPHISKVLSNAKLLFDGLESLNTLNAPASISEIADRYIRNMAELGKQIPTVIS